MDDSGGGLGISTGTIFMIVAGIVALAIWIWGILFCEQVAQEKGYNVWVARLISILLPIIGPAIYWLLGMRPSSGPPTEI